MRADRVLNGEEWRDFVVLQDHLTLRVENETDVEETIFDLRMLCLCLGHDKGVIRFRYLAKRFSFFTGNIDSAFPGERDMVEVEYLIVKCLECSFREGNQPNWKVEAG